MELRELRGEEARDHVNELAELRIAVFGEWPYIYKGSVDYERRYLETYLSCPDSLMVLAFDHDQLVGATTALPLPEAEQEMKQPFLDAGLPIDDFLYFGESVVLEAWRGRGLGSRFFEAREAHAQRLGLSRTAFCAVDRPADHPLRPAGYVGNDAFWSKRGYRRHPELQCRFEWQDLDQPAPTEKTLTFWLK
jgi:GNAT superfamily N-acetyltransferase